MASLQYFSNHLQEKMRKLLAVIVTIIEILKKNPCWLAAHVKVVWFSNIFPLLSGSVATIIIIVLKMNSLYCFVKCFTTKIKTMIKVLQEIFINDEVNYAQFVVLISHADIAALIFLITINNIHKLTD